MDVITRLGYTPPFSASLNFHSADGSQRTANRLVLHPTPEGPFHERSFSCMMQTYTARHFMAQPVFPIYELEIFPVVVAIRAWSKFSREKWCSIIWTALHRDQISFCKCFDLPGYYAGYGLCKLWTQMQSHCLACKSCQPQPPSRSTIPPDFPPIWLRDTERSELVLPIFSMVRESCKPQQPVGWTFNDELRSTLA